MVEKKYEYNLNPFYKYKGRVSKVVDGDTVDAYLDMGFNIFTQQRLRIDSFDAPESWRPKSAGEKVHGEAAKARAKELLEGHELIFTTSKEVGIYGRFGTSITLPDGRKFGEVMISEGFVKKENYEE